ncbi:MAG: hypothetical protein M9939_26575 [Mesorhizobium sp.]|nr:Gp138 family membrane-puncturing spike protein [Mesorhizobium sp.]MCO5164659.1 hypothetical protein [Mesorhizobium sp.]
MTGFLGRANRSVYADAHGGLAQDERIDTQIALPAEVVKVDYAKQTAELKVLWKPRFGDKEVEFPNLLEVPIDQPRAAGFALTLPVKEGDQGMVRFTGRDQDNWLLDDGAQTLNTDRMNSFSDGVFYPGLHSQKRAMANYDDANLFVGTDDHKNGMRVTPDGTVAIEGKGESFLQIVSDSLAVLIASADVEGPGFTPGVRAALSAIRDRLETMKFR